MAVDLSRLTTTYRRGGGREGGKERERKEREGREGVKDVIVLTAHAIQLQYDTLPLP